MTRRVALRPAKDSRRTKPTAMRLDKIIARGRIIDLRSHDLEGALQELLAVCVDSFSDLKPDALLKGLLARESTMTTYLGLGVALPHVRVKMTRRYILAIGRSRIGIRHDGAVADANLSHATLHRLHGRPSLLLVRRKPLNVNAAHDGCCGSNEGSCGYFSFGEERGLVKAEEDHDVHV